MVIIDVQIGPCDQPANLFSHVQILWEAWRFCVR